MVNFLVNQIIMQKITINDIPDSYKDKQIVIKKLEELGLL